MEFQTKTRRNQVKLLVPGLDQHPCMSRIGDLCEQTLDELDIAVGWNDPTTGQRDNNVQTFRHKTRSALTEVLLNAFAALQHQEHSNER